MKTSIEGFCKIDENGVRNQSITLRLSQTVHDRAHVFGARSAWKGVVLANGDKIVISRASQYDSFQNALPNLTRILVRPIGL